MATLFQNRPWTRHHYLLAVAVLFFVLPALVSGAKYQGQNVDGRAYSGFARSLETGRYYPATVVFENDHAKVRFTSGQSLALTLDDQEFESAEEVMAVDHLGRWWALSIDGLDGSAARRALASSESSSDGLWPAN